MKDSWHWEALGAVAVGIIGLFFKWLQSRLSGKEQFKKLFYESEEIQYRIDELQEQYPQLQRILVLQATNGGGVPRKNTQTKSSIIYEALDRDESLPLQNTWQSYVLDKPYRKILREMMFLEEEDYRSYVRVTPEELPKWSILRPIYEASGTGSSRFYFIKVEKGKLWGLIKSKAMYYISIMLTEEINDPQFEVDISSLVFYLNKNL